MCLPVMVIGEWSLPVLISTQEPFVTFSLPCAAEEGSDRAALVGTWRLARVNPPHTPWQHSLDAPVKDLVSNR